MVETWRLFIALELPTDIRTMLTTLQDRLRQHTPARTVRWVNPDGIHLTLKFLGDVPVTQRVDLENALGAAAAHHSPFTLRTGPLGCFPNTRRPRIAWVGIQGDTNQLMALRNTVEEHIAPVGYPTEDRPFSPHLTLGRMQQDASQTNVQRLGSLIAEQPEPASLSWAISGVTLFRSELKPDGAVYTTLCHVPLR